MTLHIGQQVLNVIRYSCHYFLDIPCVERQAYLQAELIKDTSVHLVSVVKGHRDLFHHAPLSP